MEYEELKRIKSSLAEALIRQINEMRGRDQINLWPNSGQNSQAFPILNPKKPSEMLVFVEDFAA